MKDILIYHTIWKQNNIQYDLRYAKHVVHMKPRKHPNSLTHNVTLKINALTLMQSNAKEVQLIECKQLIPIIYPCEYWKVVLNVSDYLLDTCLNYFGIILI